MLRTILESNEILAEVYQELPDQLQAEGRLRAPASALLQIYRESALAPSKDPSRIPIDLRHVVQDRLRPLTPAARGRLHATAAALVDNAERAHHALLVTAGPAAAAAAGPTTRGEALTAQHRRPGRPAKGPNPGHESQPGIPR